MTVNAVRDSQTEETVRELLDRFDEEAAGELLVDVMCMTGHLRKLVLCEAGRDMDTGLAVVKLAIVLTRHRALLFRAIAEDWNLLRIIQELY